jgi:hypothetical protein
MREMGWDSDYRISQILGEDPSYYAQREVITKLLFYNPQFFLGLVDTPANVMRQRVMLQSFKMIANWNRFEEALRREMILSMLVEIKLRKLYRQDLGPKLLSISQPGNG